MAAATGMGSAAACGSEACPPRPSTVIRHWSAAAIIGPGRTFTVPLGWLAVMWMANAPLTGASGTTSSSPSSSMKRAPWKPSSPGCTMNTTWPASSSRRSASSRAAPSSIATCVSCPQACIAPGTSELNGSPVSSFTGSASMSPRSR